MLLSFEYDKDWHCSVCTERTASSFCYCDGRETFLCEQCFMAHYQKTPFQVHIPAPISSYGPHKLPGYFDRLMTRSINVPRGREKLLKAPEKLDACIVEVEAAIETINTAVSQFKVSMIQRLKDEKMKLEQYINEAIAEVDSTMHEDSPKLSTKLAEDLRAYGKDFNTLQVVSYNVDPKEVTSRLAFVCRLETAIKKTPRIHG